MVNESAAVKWIELSQPELVAVARYRKECYLREVEEYNRLPRWRQMLWNLLEGRDIGVVRLLADASVDRHIDALNKNPREFARLRIGLTLHRAAKSLSLNRAGEKGKQAV